MHAGMHAVACMPRTPLFASVAFAPKSMLVSSARVAVFRKQMEMIGGPKVCVTISDLMWAHDMNNDQLIPSGCFYKEPAREWLDLTAPPLLREFCKPCKYRVLLPEGEMNASTFASHMTANKEEGLAFTSET